MSKKDQANSISEFIDIILSIQTGTKCRPILFRGQSNYNYQLLPSLARNVNGETGFNFIENEQNILETAKYYMPDIFSKNLEPIDLLALAQHYGLPTRLLDLTENAFVALYFACNGEENKSEDGEVFVFSDHFLNDQIQYPMANAIADSYRFCKSIETPLCDFYRYVKRQDYFKSLRIIEREDVNQNRQYQDWVKMAGAKPFFVTASFLSKRQQNQQGRYLLFPNEICNLDDVDTKAYFTDRIKPLEKNDSRIIKRIIIPCDKKESIKNMLNILGINDYTLFSDSIDITCQYIKKLNSRPYLEH